MKITAIINKLSQFFGIRDIKIKIIVIIKKELYSIEILEIILE